MYVTPSLSATTSYFVSINNGTCESTRTSVIATINLIPTAPITTGASGCSPSTIILNASGGTSGQYRWYTVATGGTALTGQTNSSYTTASLTTTTTYYVSINNGTCESARTLVIATITGLCSQPPIINSAPLSTTVGGIVTIDLKPLITTSETLDVNSIVLTVPPSSGAIATITNGVLTISYQGIAFTGKEIFSIRACDNNGNCSTQQFEIEVAGDVVVYNALSPNGANPVFTIEYIELIPETKNNSVTIFDRWQNEVWSASNYNNSSVVFKGVSNSGSDLPTGIYFYKIEFASGKKMQTGFLSLKR
jgi:gliding motility-associated-like protein